MNPTSTSVPPRAPTAAEARWLTGTVAHCDADTCYVSLEREGRACEARRAFGCLVAPAVGDLVAVLCDEHGQHHVIAVLHRPVEAEATLSMPGRMVIEAPAGLAVRAGQGIELQADVLDGRVGEVRWWSRLMQLTGKELLVRTGLARLACSVADLVTQRSQVQAERSYRTIAATEHVRTRVLDVQAEQVVHLRARHTLVTAQQLTKLDGAQVHVG